MPETPKRLAPKLDVLRELYLKSGNQCAYPGCSHLMMNGEGNFVGEVCHIEAALPEGERFNKGQTNEDRRTFENLMLMCHEHHVVTNDEAAYTVAKLREIKSEHEAKYTEVASKMLSSIIDHTELVGIVEVKSLSRINKVLGWGNAPDELVWTAETINRLAEKIRRLPIQTRQFLAVMMGRAHLNLGGYEVLVEEVEMACHLDSNTVLRNLSVLERHNLITEIYADINDRPVISFIDHDGWDIWKAIIEFVQKSDVTFQHLIVDLKFDLLD